MMLYGLGLAADRPHVVFVTGDDEYRSEYSMPMIARILEARHGLSTSIAYARPTPQTNDNIEGLEALRTADLAVFYLRWRTLPESQLRLILDYLDSGKPIVGLRTSTHAFQYPDGHPRQSLNDGFGIEVAGQKWIRHHGHDSSTDVSFAAGQTGHAILRGITPSFHTRSWLYVVEPLHGDCTPLLIGKTVKPQRGIDYGPQPVAWTKTYKGARVFFTTLGHPEDFQLEPMRRLLINGILWALGKEIPAAGADAAIVGEYAPPPSGVTPRPLNQPPPR
jgi:type 1 glutamine amidotransferase